MKFMKLGSKPDTLQADGKSIKYVSSELATDVVINVGDVKFYLHKFWLAYYKKLCVLQECEYDHKFSTLSDKIGMLPHVQFPLLSKSNHLHKLPSKANEVNDEIPLLDFPGGAKAFEICVKFCYGITVTLNAYNVVAVRCAAEYLEMTEDADQGNLIFKIEVFLNSSIFSSWKDSIIVLQTTKHLLPWCEDLKIVGRCVDSIASKTSVDPENITWSYKYNRKLAETEKITEKTIKFQEKPEVVPKDWWVEDICELDMDLYKRVMISVKSKGRMDGAVIGEAIKTYVVRWLPDSIDSLLLSDAHTLRYKYLLETIVCLLPSDKRGGCSCGFLLKLLKVAILVGADDSSREILVKRISLKLHEASVKDLLIPSRSSQGTAFDVQLVKCIVNGHVTHKMGDLHLDDNDKASVDLILVPGSMLDVGKLVDGYLGEIAYDPNLTVSGFVELSQSIPKSARPVHDGLYKAIDIYLKEHPYLTKAERKQMCNLMDVKKLSMDASMHAAQNERLPLRVVVQVLFFEQVRASSAGRGMSDCSVDPLHSSTAAVDTECDKKFAERSRSLRSQMSQMKMKDEVVEKNVKLCKKSSSKNSRSGVQLLPSRSRRIFDKLWVVGRSHVEDKSSEMSGSSQSPPSLAPVGTKSSGSSSRHWRYSVS